MSAPKSISVAQTIATPDDRILWGVVANAGRRSREKKFRWSHVMDATGQGSTVSRDLCVRFGFDPDEQVSKRL